MRKRKKGIQKIDILNIFLVFALLSVLGIGIYRDKQAEKANVVANKILAAEEKEKKSNNPLYEKKIIFDGDSIMYGQGYLGGFSKIISEENEMESQNLAVGGATIATKTYFTGDKYSAQQQGTQRHWISSSIDDIKGEADYIILDGGINDYWLDVPLGEITNSGSNFDETTFSGALESMFKKSKEKWPDKKIGFIITHKIDTTCYPNKNKTGFGFEAYREKIIQACNKWEIPYLDLFSESGIDTSSEDIKNKYFYQADGTHPNELGYKTFYVPKITEWLKTL